MKLLIIVQRVDINDDNLGFFHHWLEKFAGKLDKLFVVGLSVGEHRLPQNTEVFSLGKEKGYPKIGQFFRLQTALLKYLPMVDGVYVHMGSIFAISSFFWAKIFGKKLILWYAHGAIPWKLRLAEKLVDGIVTSSAAGCRLKSKKVKVLGQGIDIEKFKSKNSNKNPRFTILFAARLVPVKGHKTLIDAANILVNKKSIKNIKVRILGTPLLDSQKIYLESLKDLVKAYGLQDYIEFLAGVPYSKMPAYYNQTDLFVNPSSTGSLDKVVLEAMAAGCLVLTCNEAYRKMLADKYMFEKGNAEDLAGKIVNLITAPVDPHLREIVQRNHNLDDLIDKIIAQFHG